MDSPSIRRLRLSSSPLCRGLTDAELDSVLAVAEDRVVARGEHVFKQGDVADGLFFIARGRVQIVIDAQVVTVLNAGDVLGELSLFGGGHRRSAAAKAETELLVVWVPARPFRKMLEAWNVAAMKIVCNLTEQLTERFVALNEKLVAATRASKPEERASAVASWKL